MHIFASPNASFHASTHSHDSCDWVPSSRREIRAKQSSGTLTPRGLIYGFLHNTSYLSEALSASRRLLCKHALSRRGGKTAEISLFHTKQYLKCRLPYYLRGCGRLQRWPRNTEKQSEFVHIPKKDHLITSSRWVPADVPALIPQPPQATKVSTEVKLPRCTSPTQYINVLKPLNIKMTNVLFTGFRRGGPQEYWLIWGGSDQVKLGLYQLSFFEL